MKDIERLEETVVSGTKSQRSAAAYQLYLNIRDGKGASPDKRRAMKYLRVAAENGSIEAMYQMGWHYGTGTFVGKNIVKVLLENFDYEVIDLGKDVSPEEIVETAIKTSARLVGLSALMTTTVPEMEKNSKAFKREATGM